MSSSNRRIYGRARGNTGWQHVLSIGGVVIAAFMAGCGGGGGSDGDPLINQVPARPITITNAESAVKLALEMTDITDVLTSTWGLGGGINQTRCESGSGIGTVSNCVIGANTLNGAVAATVETTKTVVIPGDTLSRVMPTSMTLAITNLQWQSSNNRTTYSVSGNLSLTYTYPVLSGSLATASATGTLTLTDVNTNVRYQYRSLTQRYSVSANDDRNDYLFRQTDRKGVMVYMDENQQYKLDPGSIFDYLTLVGSVSKLALTSFAGNYSMRIDTDNDGNYDTFSTMPASELGKGHSANNSAPTVSVSRQGGNSSVLDKRAPATLNASASDADYNFYTYSWAVTNKPPAATGDNAPVTASAAQSTGTLSFTGSVAGNYDITVTATEAGVPSPKSATALITLRVGQDTPELDVPNLQNAVGTVGTQVSFPVTLQNLEGTTPPRLLSSPAGMKLDGNQLIWDPQPQFFPGASETVTLQVSNEDRTTTESFTVTVNNAGLPPQATPGLAINSFTTDANLLNVSGDAKAELLMASNNSAFFGLNLGGSAPAVEIANPYVLDADADNLIAIKPLRTNGTVSAYAVASTRGVFVIDPATYAVRASRGLQFNLLSGVSKRRFAVADVNADGTDEIIALTKTVNSDSADQLFVLTQGLATLATTATTPLGQQFLVGNVDADADLEIVCGNGLILNAATLATETNIGELGGSGKNYVLANVDADSQKEIVAIRTGEIAVFDAESATPISIAFGLNTTNLNVFAVDADGDVKDELLIGSTNNQVSVYSINKSAPSATLVRTLGTAAANSTITEVVRGNVTGDATEELVFVSRNSGGGGGALINVATLAGSLLIDGTAQPVATGGFAAARAQETTVANGFFTASLLRNGIAGKGLLAVDAVSAPVAASLDIAADTALFAASGDIDANGQWDFVVSTTQRGDTDMSILAQLTGVSFWPLTVTGGTPAPITLGQIDDSANLDAVYIERTGTVINAAVSLVVQEVSGSELARLVLQASGPLTAAPVAVAIANLDGDANRDILVLDAASLRTFEYSAGTLQPTATLALSGTPLALAVGDADGDGRDEIAVSRTGTSNSIQVYKLDLATLALLGETAMFAPPTTLTFYQPPAPDSKPLWLYGVGSKVAALDASSLIQIWISPALHGQINSVEVLADQLRVGSEGAIYRSQP